MGELKFIVTMIAIIGVLVAGFVLNDLRYSVSEETNEPANKYNTTSVKVANWNLQIFGDSKASDDELMQLYRDKIDDYDIIFIQEIRDKDGSSFDELCAGFTEHLCSVSSRAGRSTSKEQYGVIYRNTLTLLDFKDYNPDAEDRWERPPIKTTFVYSNGSLVFQKLIIYNIHVKPADVEQELSHLENIVEPNSMVIGDLNADCDYYNEEESTAFDSWDWIVTNEEDTTASATDCAYDRIIAAEPLTGRIVDYGIDNSTTTEESDHYLIWVEIK